MTYDTWKASEPPREDLCEVCGAVLDQSTYTERCDWLRARVFDTAMEDATGWCDWCAADETGGAMITSEANVHGRSGVSAHVWEKDGTRGLTINLGEGVAAFTISFYNEGLDTAMEMAAAIVAALAEFDKTENIKAVAASAMREADEAITKILTTEND